MDAGPRDGSRPGHDAGSLLPRASDRLQLEVELLAAAATAPSDDGIAAVEPSRTVLLAVGDANLRDYIRQCLRQRADLHVVELRAGDDPLDVARRGPVDLVITDGWALPDGVAPGNRVPLLLIGDERSDVLPFGEGAGIAFLLQPFNAGRLLDMAARLLGQAGG